MQQSRLEVSLYTGVACREGNISRIADYSGTKGLCREASGLDQQGQGMTGHQLQGPSSRDY